MMAGIFENKGLQCWKGSDDRTKHSELGVALHADVRYPHLANARQSDCTRKNICVPVWHVDRTVIVWLSPNAMVAPNHMRNVLWGHHCDNHTMPVRGRPVVGIRKCEDCGFLDN